MTGIGRPNRSFESVATPINERVRSKWVGFGLTVLVLLCVGVVASSMFVPSVKAARWGTPAVTTEPSPTAVEKTEEKDEAPAEPVLIGVPAPYAKLIKDSVKEHCPALPPNILAGQLAQESSFDPKAKSPAGAKGIAQFIPSTWKNYAIDGNGDGKRDIWDPEDAIPSAAVYDCALLQYTKGIPGHPIVNMLAAYNAGPGAVQEYNGVPPFEETQHYVDRVVDLSSRLSWPKLSD